MKIIFFGSDDFSLATLNACLESPHQVSLVVTTPPQKQGRGLVLTPTPVQVFAESRRLPCEAPADLKDDHFAAKIRALAPELFVVASYGKFIPGRYLSIPAYASLNVHPSLIPLYRGSSPIQWPILNGDLETGVSIIEVARKLDAGDVFVQVRMPLRGTETHPSLRAALAELSHDELLKLLRSIPEQPLKRTPQQENMATYAPKLTKEDGRLSFARMSAREIDRKIRALQPWPGTFTEWFGQRTSILAGTIEPSGVSGKPGTLLSLHPDGAMTVAAREGALRIRQIQPAGKNPMSAAAFANGRRLKPGDVLEETA